MRGLLSGREAPAAHIFVETTDGDVRPADIASFALGAMLRGYKFKKYKTKSRKKNGAANETDERTLKKIVIHCADPKAAAQAFAPARAIAEGVSLARDLVNEPANVLGPAEFATRAKALSKLGVQVELLGPAALKKLGGLPDPPATLQPREIESVVDFLMAKVVGKGPMDRAACIEYFGAEVEACKDLK